MNLSVYSIKDLQHTLQILQQIEVVGLAEGRRQIKQYLAEFQANLPAPESNLPWPEPRPCPECDSVLEPAIVPVNAGVRVWGCKNCRYSMMEELP